MVAFDEMYTLFNAFDGVIKFLHGQNEVWCLRGIVVVVVVVVVCISRV
jgi:hypothetical protein